MAQQVTSVPNPNYAVAPLTTVAGSIVSRRRIKVPANISGTYGHLKGTYPSTITFDIADNESFVDLSKLVFVCDFFLDLPANNPAPSFDGDVQALFSRVTIGSSQGLKIEEIQEYGLLSNMVQSCTQTSMHKQHNVFDKSSYENRQFESITDGISFYDTIELIPQHKLKCQKWNRLHIRFHQSSFLNRVKMLPLFLFRNGLRIEFELADFYRTFVYKTSPSFKDMWRVNLETSVVAEGARHTNYAVYSEQLRTGNDPTTIGDFSDVSQPDQNGRRALSFSSALAVCPDIATKIMGRIGQLVNAANNDNAARRFTVLIPFTIVGPINDEYDLGVQYSGLMAVPSQMPLDFSGDQTGNLKGIRTHTAGRSTYLLDWKYTLLATTPRLAVVQLFACTSVIPANNINLHTLQYTNINKIPQGFLAIDFDNAIIYDPVNAAGQTLTKPFSALHGNFVNYLTATAETTVSTGYYLKNPELLLDVVKPSADDFLKYTQAFQSPSGIPYNYKRIIYKTRVLENISSQSMAQISLDLAVRSLTGLLFTIQDPIAGLPQSDPNQYLSYPCLSSFLRRGLVRFEVQVGGQQYPLYPLFIRRTNDNTAKNEPNESFMLELENFFGVNGTAGIIPSISRQSLNRSRSYGMTHSQAVAGVSAATLQGSLARAPYFGVDAASCVFGLSLSKDDVNNFASGVDSSQSGSVILNLYFDDSEDLKQIGLLGRPMRINMFCFCDAVFTLQSDANLVRY